MGRRARTLKPEVLEDERTATLSDMAFRLFVSVIVLADDYGRLRADLRFLQSQIYWCRDVDREAFARAWSELTGWLVQTYAVEGQAYAQIRNWSRHQRVDRPGKPAVPPMPHITAPCATDSRVSRESVASVSRDPRECLATEWNGMEWKGKESMSGVRGHATGERNAAGASAHTHNLPDCSREDEPGTRFDATPRPTPPDESKPVLKAISAETKTAEQKPSQIPARAELQPQRISDTAPAEPGDPPPTWWDDVLALVSVQIGIDLPRVESWIRYAGHRASKARPAERRDAAHWVTSVLVAEHRRDRERRHRETRAPDIPANETELRDLETRFPMRRRAKP